MTLPDLAPRGTIGGIVSVWALTLLAGVAIGVFTAPDSRAPWLAVALGGSVVVSFAVQLSQGRSQRFLFRMAVSVLGSLLLLGIVSAAFGLASLVPG